MEKYPSVVDKLYEEILHAEIKFVLIVITDSPVNTVVPPVCVILLANVAVCATPSVVVFEDA